MMYSHQLCSAGGLMLIYLSQAPANLCNAPFACPCREMVLVQPRLQLLAGWQAGGL